jgi:cytochrome c oxidase assembly protein subunit 11
MRRTTRTALLAVVGVCSMTGLGFASVPLYRMFCEATGFGGTTQRALAAPGATSGAVTVQFDGNVGRHLDWTFRPEQTADRVQLGARKMAFFTATNRSSAPVTGTATFNVAPVHAGRYFAKIECFCFTEQVLKPGETVRMPVIYYIDPAIAKDPDAKDIETITLSYTFYPVDSGKKAS